VLFDEAGAYAVSGLKCFVVPLDLVRGKLACQADDASDRLKVAVDILIMDESGQIGPRRDSLIKKLLRPFGAKPFFQLLCLKPDIAAGNAAITRRGAVSDQALFQDDNMSARPRQREGGRQPGKAASDDGDIGMWLPGGGRGGLRWSFLPPKTGKRGFSAHQMTMSNCMLAVKLIRSTGPYARDGWGRLPVFSLPSPAKIGDWRLWPGIRMWSVVVPGLRYSCHRR
jgi:hypothetical protein